MESSGPWGIGQSFRIPNLVNEYKIIFLGKRGKAWNSPKNLTLYWSFQYICFEVSKKPKSNLVSGKILVEGFRMPNLLHKYKTIFLAKRDKAWNPRKTFSLEFSIICFEVSKKPKSNLVSDRVLVQGFRMPNLVDEYNNIFMGNRDKPCNSSKAFSLY